MQVLTQHPDLRLTEIKLSQHFIQGIGIGGAGHFTDGVHGEGGYADVDGFDADFTGSQWADGTAAGHVVAHHKGLHRHFGLLAQASEYGAGLAIGGVALIGVDLDDRAVVQQGTVVVVMLVCVVGMHAMGIVRGDQHGTVYDAAEVFRTAGDALQHRVEKGALGADGGNAAHFLVVIAHQHAGDVGAGLDKAHQADVAAEQVVQPGAGEEFLVNTDNGRRLSVIKTQFVVQHFFEVDIFGLLA